jgi:hypothetical protein
MAIDEVLQQRILSSKSCVTDTISVMVEISTNVSQYLDHSPMSPSCNFSGVLIREVRLGLIKLPDTLFVYFVLLLNF